MKRKNLIATVARTSLLCIGIGYSISLCFGQELKVGDNIYNQFKKLKPSTEVNCPSMSHWVDEQNLLLFGTNPDISTNKVVFFTTADKYPFAIFIKQQDSIYYLLDINNDSILETNSQLFYLPYQIIKRQTKISSTDTTVLSLFNKFYNEVLQADDNLDLDTATVNSFTKYYTDTTLANRHLVYLLDTYQKLVTDANEHNESSPSYLCIPIMKDLSVECIKIFNKIPVLVLVYMGETLMSAGLEDKAREHFKMSLKFYPNSIPLQVYDYQLEQDYKKKIHKLNVLKINYPKHWMVKDL